MIVVWSILAGADRMELENGMELRLLSALEEWVEQAPGPGREKESRRQKLGRLLVKILRKIREELIGC